MANCHDLFELFHERIKLPPTKKEALKQGRDALRKRIKNYFLDRMNNDPPKFWIQGSYAMSTIINPLNGEYDIDDGVYLQNLDSDKEKWPTPVSVHSWIYKAVEGHTKTTPVDKRTCIRVIYSGEYHVDLPIYGVCNNDYYLAERGEKGWNVSDPRALTEWFNVVIKKNDEQLRRNVRYIKAWSDYKSKSNGKLPSGLLLTVLVSDNYNKYERDDTSFGANVNNVINKIKADFTVHNPVDLSEDLAKSLTIAQKQTFINLLSSLVLTASTALKEDNRKKASELWKKEFGDRFPVDDDSGGEKKYLVTSAPALLKDNAKSA